MENFNNKISSEIKQNFSGKEKITYDPTFLRSGIGNNHLNNICQAIDPTSSLQQLPINDAFNELNQFLEPNFQQVPRNSGNFCEVMTPTTTIPVKKVEEEKVKALLEKTGYSLDVTPGQRRYGGPPPNWDGSTPGKGCEVFCGKIPKDMYEYELVPMFERCGAIWDLRLMMDPLNGINRGFAFIKFTTREGATKAVRRYNNYQIKPHNHIKVILSDPNTQIFVGNIPKYKDKDDIINEFGKRTPGLVDVILYTTTNDPKKNRGFCFLEYESHRAASFAKRKLEHTQNHIWGGGLIIKWAKPEEEPDEQRMNRVKTLFVRNLTREVTEDLLKTEFEQYGTVERVRKNKSYAFVHFELRECALRAMRELNGKELGSLNMEVSLAKPVPDTHRNDENRHAREQRLRQGHPNNAANLSLHSQPNMTSLRVPMWLPGGLRVQQRAPMAVPNMAGPIPGGGWLGRIAAPHRRVVGFCDNMYQLGAPQLPPAVLAAVLSQLGMIAQPETEAFGATEHMHHLVRSAQLAQLASNYIGYPI